MVASAAERAEQDMGGAPARRPWWRLPLLLAAGLVYALLFGELFLRLLSPQALVPRYVTAGPDGVRANMPGAAFRQWTPEVDVMVRYNAAGQRDDRPPPGPRAPGDCRIALLGDSYFVGFESDWPNSFAARLEEALSRRGHPCRVVNFAVSGFGHAENLRILESRVWPFKPDVLLMSVHQTEGFDNLRADLYRPGPSGAEPTGKSYLPGIAISDRLNQLAIYRWAQENSHLYAAAREWAGSMGKKLLATMRMSAADEDGDAAGTEAAATDAAATVLPAWAGNPVLNVQLVAAIDHDARASGARLMLFEIPSSSSRTRYVPVADKLLPPELMSAGALGTLPMASPIGRFQAIAGPDVQLYLEKGHKHWTALGNRVAAEAAADALIEDGLLPRRG
jgi:hypothetical protein